MGKTTQIRLSNSLPPITRLLGSNLFCSKSERFLFCANARLCTDFTRVGVAKEFRTQLGRRCRTLLFGFEPVYEVRRCGPDVGDVPSHCFGGARRI